jgi:pimeloyl-ACP methyl ester carboxylesterase
VVPLLEAEADIRIADVLTQSSIADMARDALALVADVPAGHPLAVCGFSMGGYVAIEMVANNDRPIRTLGLLDTSAQPDTAEAAVMREKTIAAMARNFPKVVDNLLPFNLHPDSLGNAGLLDELRQILLDTGAEVATRQFRTIMARADHRDALRQLAVSTLVMCGRADRVTPPALSEDLAALIPAARLEWIEHAGHMGVLEQPARVAGLLRTLLP